jgi:AbrB family looped-hinge helix DNA binding protein
MELAKITSKGQITLPVQIRKRLSLKDGDKVLFVERDGKFFVENPTKLAILEAQEAFAGLAAELGLETEEDVVSLCKEVRKERLKKQNAHYA